MKLSGSSQKKLSYAITRLQPDVNWEQLINYCDINEQDVHVRVQHKFICIIIEKSVYIYSNH